MRKVGSESTLVAIIGVVIPFALGVVMTLILLPEIELQVDLFIAATLVATSVGITARVLKDIGHLQSRSAKVILGAAVIDDVLGLIMLAIVTGIIVSGSINLLEISMIILMSGIFFLVAFWFGPYFLKKIIWLIRHLDIVEAKIFISFLFVMTLA